MSDTVENLILDLLEWLGPRPRPYSEVLDAWRTSCPRLPVWEEVNERGYVDRHHVRGLGQFVSVTAVGVEHLRASGRRSPAGGSADQRVLPVGLGR
jgi:hypothetical protein